MEYQGVPNVNRDIIEQIKGDARQIFAIKLILTTLLSVKNASLDTPRIKMAFALWIIVKYLMLNLGVAFNVTISLIWYLYLQFQTNLLLFKDV